MNKQEIIDEFHKYYYDSNVWSGETMFLNRPVAKNPMDLWRYQEIIFKVKPKVIIETGTYYGGSATWLSCCQQMSGIENSMVITIDTRQLVTITHPNITQIIGWSVAPGAIKTCENIISQLGGPVIVILDSNHAKENVLRELELYAYFVTSGSYLIVEDTNINGNPVLSDYGEGPREAIDTWYPLHYKDFEVDKDMNKFMLTFNPGGYFVRNS